MKKNRVIPILLLKNGWLVQSRGFHKYNNIGNPVTSVQRLSQWASDELIFLDISRDDNYDLRRDDQGYENRKEFIEIIKDIAQVTFMPLTVGGRIRSLKDMEKRLLIGADKVALNTKAFENPEIIAEAAAEFGSQCIVISVDVKAQGEGHEVFIEGGSSATGMQAVEWCCQAESLGAGEILLNSIDRDGVGNGYDMPLLQSVSDAVSIPVIACGGAGEWSHFAEALKKTRVDAVAAANIFHHIDQSVFYAKKTLSEQGINVRRPDIIKIS